MPDPNAFHAPAFLDSDRPDLPDLVVPRGVVPFHLPDRPVRGRLVRLGLGGPVAGGQQYVSWLHDVDFVQAVRWLIARNDLAGAVNLAAPHPLPYAAFMRALRAAWGMPIGLPATRWMVAIGALLLRTEPELALKSRRVIPGVLTQSGFRFQHPTWAAAAVDLSRRWKARGH